MTTKLSPLDLPLPDVHIHEILCFETDGSLEEIQHVLTHGLQKAIELIPFLASSLVFDPESETSTCIPTISSPHRTTNDILTFYDMSDRLSYATLQHVDFQLEELTIPLVKYISSNRPRPDGLSSKATTEVFAATAVKVDGGVVLTVFVNHLVVDAIGLGTILRVWADCCGGDGGEDVLDGGSLDRDGVAERVGFREDEDGKMLEEEMGGSDESTGIEQEQEREDVPEGMLKQSTMPIPEVLGQIMLRFPASALEDLKAALNAELAQSSAAHPTHANNIKQQRPLSTNSALTALLWCTITASRPGSYTKTNDETTSITVPINLRPRLVPALPATYVGNAVAAASPSASRELVLRGATDVAALAEVAVMVQEAVGAVDAGFVRRCFARGSDGHGHHDDDDEDDASDANNETNDDTDNNEPPDLPKKQDTTTPTSSSPIPSLFNNPTTDLTINSWATQPIYAFSWGPHLHTCQHMTRLKCGAEVVLILPKLPNGDLEVQVPLEKETCKRLRKCVVDDGRGGYLIGKWASVVGAKRRGRKDSFGLLEWIGWGRRGGS